MLRNFKGQTLPKMKKILFPTDFSDASKQAFVYALHLANELGAEIVTLHVYEMPVVDYMDVPAYLMEVYDTVELANFENYKGRVPVLHQIAEAQGLQNVPMQNVLLDGDLVGNILRLVKDDHIDFVVMGTKGATGAKETFLGTSTASVMTGTDASVLAVPDGSVFQPVRRIVFATRYEEDDFKALKKLLPIATAFGARIDCVCVCSDGFEPSEVVRADWELLLKNENVDFHRIEGSDTEEALLDFIGQNQTDILAILNHRRSFFESLFRTSLTRKLAFHSKIPVLALH